MIKSKNFRSKKDTATYWIIVGEEIDQYTHLSTLRPKSINDTDEKYWILPEIGITFLRFHRLDGPALVYDNGATHWFINNIKINETIYKQWLLDNGIDINNLSEEDEQLIMLVWGF